MPADRLVCLCKGVTANEVRRAIATGARTLEDIARAYDGAGILREVCRSDIAGLLATAHRERENPPGRPAH